MGLVYMQVVISFCVDYLFGSTGFGVHVSMQVYYVFTYIRCRILPFKKLQKKDPLKTIILFEN